eukprot:scaffold226750_cov15-Tisochrysis_lutea.AAC.1
MLRVVLPVTCCCRSFPHSQLWGEEVMVMAEEFDAEDVIVCLASAAKGGVSLSSPARTKLVGRLLEVAAPKPVP